MWNISKTIGLPENKFWHCTLKVLFELWNDYRDFKGLNEETKEKKEVHYIDDVMS